MPPACASCAPPVTRLEAEIEETEAEIEELQAQLSAGADYQALMDLTAKLDAATAAETIFTLDGRMQARNWPPVRKKYE